MAVKKSKRICPKGHVYYKSSNCPVCPVCGRRRNTGASFLSLLGAPARRALEGAGISTLTRLSKFSEKDVLQLHGIGASSVPVLREALAAKGLSFKQ